jgi:aminoglycoside 3-N-acetyltransferase
VITSLTNQLRALGVTSGDTLMIHASMRRVGKIEGGADALIDALLATVSPGGTLFAYADFEPTPQVPFFDVHHSPCAFDHGVFPEVLRKRAGVLRSLNPGASVLALGARALALTEPHPLHYGYGPGTPFERFVECGGKVLLLGSSLDAVTLLHYVEAIAELPGKRVIQSRVQVLAGGEVREVGIEEFDTSEPVLSGMPEDYFERCVRAYLKAHELAPKPVGASPSYLLDAATLVRETKALMEREYGGTPSGRVR